MKPYEENCFLPQAFNDYNDWIKLDKKIHAKIVELIKEIQRDLFVGKGKPEPLKHQLSELCYGQDELPKNTAWFIKYWRMKSLLFLVGFIIKLCSS